MKTLKTLKDLAIDTSSDHHTLRKQELLDAIHMWITELEKKDYMGDDYPLSEWTYQRRRGAIDWITLFFNLEEKP